MKPTYRSTSFTLVEMLVALAIFSVLVLLIFQIMSDATTIWRTQTAKEQNFEEARSALNTIARDVNSAVISTNAAWFYSAPNQVAFLTTLPADAQNTNIDGGDICAVGYSLEYGTNDVSGIQTNMSLYRYLRFSNPTYSTIVNGGANVDDVFFQPDGTNTVRELIARDIAQVSFVAYNTNSAGVLAVTEFPTTLPPMLDISLVALNDKAAATLTTLAQWENTNSAVFRQNEESFTLRVRPKNP